MSVEQIARECDEAGGLIAKDLGELRDAINALRLGPHVNRKIVLELDANALGYFPRELLDKNPQPRQDQRIRLYRKGTRLARVIEAVLAPSAQADAELRRLAVDDASQIVERIRDVLNETAA